MPTKIAPLDFKDSWVISDNDDFLRECTAVGFNTQSLSQIEHLPACSVVFSFCNDAARKTFDIAKHASSKQSIFCATHVFEPSVKSALYGLSLIMKSDFYAALHKQKLILALLDAHTQFDVKGQHADASVVISEDATPYAMIEEDITSNFIYSAAEFFEVHYAHMNAQTNCPFQFSGYLTIFGILTVLRKHTPLPDNELKLELEQLTLDVAQHTALLIVEHNTITSFKVNHIEHITLLERAAGSRGLKLTEFAVGVNDAIAPFIDYSVNSQMNEGISGIHVALGDGSSGYHIDFLCPGAVFNPAPPL